MPTNASIGTGLYAAGEKSVVVYDPDVYRFNARAPVVIWAHGRGSDALQGFTESYTAAMGRAIAAAGYLYVAIDAGGPSQWSNDAAMAAVDSARTWAQSAFNAKPGPCAVMGFSMGGMTAANYSKFHASNTLCVITMNGAVDLQYFHDNGFTSEIETMYGGASWQTNAIPSHSPLQAAQAGSFNSTPPGIAFFAEDDPTVLPTSVRAFVKAAPTWHGWSVGSPVGHSPVATPVEPVLHWLSSYAPIG